MTATTLNSNTSRTCMRAPAEPCRRATHTRVSRPASEAPSSSSTETLVMTSEVTRFGRSDRGAPRDISTKLPAPSTAAVVASSRVAHLPRRMSATRLARERGGEVMVMSTGPV